MMTSPTFHDNPAFPPHASPDLVDILAEVAYEWRRDNGAYCKELLEKVLERYPWSKEAADWYGLVMSKLHHIYNDMEMIVLHEWMAAHQVVKGKPYMVDDGLERFRLMKAFLTLWLTTHSPYGVPWKDPTDVPQWARIVDVGAHMGEMAINWIGLLGARDCVALDIALGNLLMGEKFFGDPRLHFVLAMADKLPIKTDSVDVVILSGILEHVRNPGELVSEAERVLRSGGVVIIQVPYGGMEGEPNPEADKLSFRSHVRCINPFDYTAGREVLLSSYVRYTGDIALPHSIIGECGDFVVAYRLASEGESH